MVQTGLAVHHGFPGLNSCEPLTWLLLTTVLRSLSMRGRQSSFGVKDGQS